MQKTSTKSAAAYMCEPCVARSPEPGTCCGTAMKPVSESVQADRAATHARHAEGSSADGALAARGGPPTPSWRARPFCLTLWLS